MTSGNLMGVLAAVGLSVCGPASAGTPTPAKVDQVGKVTSGTDTKLSLAPADPQVIAADAIDCLRHLGVHSLASAALEAEGWRPHRSSDLPERHFIDTITAYARGDGVAIGCEMPSAGNNSFCSLVALPKGSTDFAPIKEAISAALAAHPVFEGKGRVLWAPNGSDDPMLMLTADPHRSDLINVVLAPLARVQPDHSRFMPGRSG